MVISIAKEKELTNFLARAIRSSEGCEDEIKDVRVTGLSDVLVELTDGTIFEVRLGKILRGPDPNFRW